MLLIENKGKQDVVLVLHTHLRNNEIELIRKMGLRILYIKAELTYEETMSVDYPYEIGFRDVEGTINLVSQMMYRYNVKYIFTLNEYYISIAAQLAEKYNLSHYAIGCKAAEACRNKKKAKRIFKEEHIPSADYILIKSPLEFVRALEKFKYPIVVKPSNDSGSNLVSICDDIQELQEAVTRIYTSPFNYVNERMDNEVLIEEYIDGQEYSIETYTIKGEHNIVAFTYKETKNSVEIGHTVPAKLSKKDESAISKIVENALNALDVKYGVTHTEIKLTDAGPKIIEINGRPGGDHIDELVKMAKGLDIREIALKIAISGEYHKPEGVSATSASAAILFLYSPRTGRVIFKIDDSFYSHPGLKDYYLPISDGDWVSKTTNNFNRLGYFITTDFGSLDANEVGSQVLENIHIKVITK